MAVIVVVVVVVVVIVSRFYEIEFFHNLVSRDKWFATLISQVTRGKLRNVLCLRMST